jgi:hypothetical protein
MINVRSNISFQRIAVLLGFSQIAASPFAIFVRLLTNIWGQSANRNFACNDARKIQNSPGSQKPGPFSGRLLPITGLRVMESAVFLDGGTDLQNFEGTILRRSDAPPLRIRGIANPCIFFIGVIRNTPPNTF